jgi:AraC-like DNA-binding protein
MAVRIAASPSQWQTFSSETFVPVRAEAALHFSASLDHRGSSDAGISSIRSDACGIHRDRELLSASADDVVLFSLQLRGRNYVSQYGRQATVNPGDGVIYLTRAPYDLIFPDLSELVVLQLPLDWCGIPANTLASLAAQPMRVRNNAALRTACRVLRSQFGTGQAVDPAWSIRVATKMLGSALRQRINRPSPPRSHDALFASFDRLVSDHLDDTRLDVPALAAAENVSVRTVHQVFAERGLRAAAHIRASRIARAQRLLRATNLPIPDVALRCGIADPTVFTRAFRNEVGMTPTQYRSAQSSPAGV